MEESANVTAEKPCQVQVMRQNFVLFRDEQGKVHCLHDVCAHRGGALSKGKVLGNNVQCPYHGWQYNGEGSCTKIPSLGKDNLKIPGRAKVDSYPTQEQHGLIFAFLGDLPEHERPPLPLPENNHYDFDYTQPQWRQVSTSWKIKANYERCVENGVDPAHNEFVHPRHGFGGTNEQYHIPPFDLMDHNWGHGWKIDFYAPPSTHEALQRAEARTESGYMEAYSGFNGPNQIWTYIHISPTNFLHQYIWETPIDEFNTRAFLINFSNFMDSDIASDEELIEMNVIIADDDVGVLEALEPKRTPENMTQELMTPSDKAIVAYRKMLKSWDSKGWRIDSKSLNSVDDNKTYAIPCPRRRQDKGWVFDATPLLGNDH